MLLLKLKNNVVRKKSIISPFFLFYKSKNYKKVKPNSHNTSSILNFKKSSKLDHYITPKSNKNALSVFSDNNTISYQETSASTSRHLTSVNCWFTEDRTNINTLFLMLELSWDVFFYKIFNPITGKVLYNCSGGNYIEVQASDDDSSNLEIVLPSGKKKQITRLSVGIVGRSSGVFKKYNFIEFFKKKQVLKKKRLCVRGIAMNPVDHPNGGRSNTKKPFLNKFNHIAKRGK